MSSNLIFHVDINSCYASCEKILDPSLARKPAVVLSNNDGCIIALDAHAKALGFSMGQPWFEVKQRAHEQGVIARSSNYELYGDISDRVMRVLQEYAADFEQYSIDEAFLSAPVSPAEAQSLARTIKDDLARRVGVPVCVGVARTKTLAKLSNKAAKKIPALSGVCVWDALPTERREALLTTLPVSELWGVGSHSARRLTLQGICSIKDLALAPPTLIRERFNVVLMRTALEVRGIPAIEWEENRIMKDQLIYSRSFSDPITTEEQMCQVLSVYAQRAAQRLVKHQQTARYISAFCSTSYFAQGVQSHPAVRVKLDTATADPVVITRASHRLLTRADFGVARYVRAGIILTDLHPAAYEPLLEPFISPHDKRQIARLLHTVQEQCGEHSVGLGYAGLSHKPSWEMKREMLSPRGTTHWNELATAKIR